MKTMLLPERAGKMNEKNSVKLLLFLLITLGVCTNAQFSLDEMIQQVRQDNGFVFDKSPTRPPTPTHSHSTNTHQHALDSRYDSNLSKVVANRILQLSHQITLQVQGQNLKNCIMSPISIAGALALVLLGANGRTFAEAMHMFRFDQDRALLAHPYKIHEEFGLLIEDLLSDYQHPSRPRPLHQWKYLTRTEHRRGQPDLNFTTPSQYHKISMANSIFLQNGFSLRPSYQDAVLNVYRSEITSLDFRSDPESAKKHINDWVNSKTHGKIRQIVGSEINSATKMIIASALYFKALWETTFIEGGTNTKNFYPDGLGGTPMPVEMMAHGGLFPFYDAKEYDCRILGFPYRGNQTTMYIILPNNSNRRRLREIQTLLTPEKIEDMISKMQLKTAVILFPKLHIQNTIDLRGIFQKMGLTSLFESSHSDLSLVSSGRTENFKKPTSRPAARPSARPSARPPAQSQPSVQVQSKPLTPVNNRKQTAETASQSPSNSNLENQLIFSRFGVDSDSDSYGPEQRVIPLFSINISKWAGRRKRAVTYKVESNFRNDSAPLRYKDFVLSKRITKQSNEKKLLRNRRQTNVWDSIKRLDELRNSPGLRNPNIFADAIVHKIDLIINEQGTEGGAATAVYLTRTGTDVVFRVETPFLLLIRHDATRVPLFYGTVYEPDF